MFDSEVDTPQEGNTNLRIVPPPEKGGKRVGKLGMAEWVVVWEKVSTSESQRTRSERTS